MGWTVSLYGSVEFGRERTVGYLSRQLKIDESGGRGLGSIRERRQVRQL